MTETYRNTRYGAAEHYTTPRVPRKTHDIRFTLALIAIAFLAVCIAVGIGRANAEALREDNAVLRADLAHERMLGEMKASEITSLEASVTRLTRDNAELLDESNAIQSDLDQVVDSITPEALRDEMPEL